MFFADGNFLYSPFKIQFFFMSQILLLMVKYFILDRHFLKTAFWLFLKAVYQHLFTFASTFVLRKAA